MENNKKNTFIPSRIKMTVKEIVSMQQSMQEILMQNEEIQVFEIYAKILKVFIAWSKLEKQEYGIEMQPLKEIKYVINLMESGKLDVEIVK